MTNPIERNQNIQQLRQLIEGIDCAMLTTLDDDGSLHSRPMSVCGEIDSAGVLWFFSLANSYKIHEIQHHQQVNVSFSAPDHNRYISISGTAQLVREHNKLQEKWQAKLETWFPQGLDEPNIALLKVKIHKADYWDSSSNFAAKTISLLELSHI